MLSSPRNAGVVQGLNAPALAPTGFQGRFRRRAAIAALLLLASLARWAHAQPASQSPAASGAAPDALLPAISFYGQSDIQSVKLSPSGRHLAVQAGLPTQRVGLVVFELEGGLNKPTVVANYADADVGTFEWVNDERLVYSLADS